MTARLPAHSPTIVVIEPDGQRRAPVTLTTGGLTVGRDESNDLVLADPRVSRQHLRIDWDGRQATVTDLGSTGGTTLGNTQIRPRTPQVWHEQDWLTVGPYWIRFEWSDQALTPHIQQEAPVTPIRRTRPATDPGSSRPGGQSRILVLPSESALEINPGTPAVVTVELANLGTNVDRFTVTVEGVPEEWVTISNPEVDLLPDARGSVVLQVNVEPVATNRSGDYPVTIRATSEKNPGESETAQMHWTVLPFMVSSLTITPERASGKRASEFEIALQNKSNLPIHYDLTGSDEERALTFKFDPPSTTLGPGEVKTVPLVVEAPRRWVGMPKSRTFLVESIPATPGVSAPVARGQFDHQAMVPAWAVPLALMAIGALCVLAYLLWPTPPQPEIVQAWIDPPEPQTNQAFTVHWKVKHTDRIVIDQLILDPGDPVPGESDTRASFHIFSEGRQASGDLTLAAFNDNGKTERMLLVNVIEPTPTPTTIPGAPVFEYFEVNTEQIMAGQSVTLSWSVANADEVTLTGLGPSPQPVPPTHTQTVAPAQTTTYTLFARNSVHSDARDITVTVQQIAEPPPTPTATLSPTPAPTDTPAPTATGTPTPEPGAPVIVNFTVTPGTITIGMLTEVTITWEVRDAESVEIDQIGTVGLKGTEKKVITDTTSFTLTARNADKTSTQRRDVIGIPPATAAPTPTATATASATPTLEPTHTPTATVTPTATPTIDPAAPPVEGNDLRPPDNFAQNWWNQPIVRGVPNTVPPNIQVPCIPAGTFSSQLDGYHVGVEPALNPDDCNFLFNHTSETFGDASVGIDVRIATLAVAGEACLAARVDPTGRLNNAYLFCVDQNGWTQAYYYAYGMPPQQLLVKALRGSVRPVDQFNNLKIIMRGNRLWFLLNGTALHTEPFQHFGVLDGTVGVFVQNDSPHTIFEAVFTNLTVKEIP